MPTDLELAKAKANEKRRRGPYSIPTFLTTNQSALHTNPPEHEGDVVMKQNGVQVVKDRRVSVEKAYSSRDASPPGLDGGHHC
jgi:hypothetical protein